MTLAVRLAACLAASDPKAKVAWVGELWDDWQRGRLARQDAVAVPAAGRPIRPVLVSPHAVPRRNPASPAGRAALVHAIAHIEFNAINLALDAALRFWDMPVAFTADWLRVAAEEAEHFSLLAAHLETLGFAYGDFPAHDGLWQMAEKTAHDVLVRMALVPRVLEARGLDATPQIVARLDPARDGRFAEILARIERDEVGHVAIGNRWYHALCEARGLHPVATFERLLAEYDAPALKPPFNLPARERAGFTAEELAWLSARAAPRR